jgi:hypothetical protein
MTDDTAAAREKHAADQRRRELQAIDAPKAWAAYQADIQAVRTRTEQLRAQRLAREAAAKAAAAAPVRAKKSRAKKPGA